MITYTLAYCVFFYVSYSLGNVCEPAFRGEAGIGVGGMAEYYITVLVMLHSSVGIYDTSCF